jgi:hypothetical protein
MIMYYTLISFTLHITTAEIVDYTLEYTEAYLQITWLYWSTQRPVHQIRPVRRRIPRWPRCQFIVYTNVLFALLIRITHGAILRQITLPLHIEILNKSYYY